MAELDATTAGIAGAILGSIFGSYATHWLNLGAEERKERREALTALFNAAVAVQDTGASFAYGSGGDGVAKRYMDATFEFDRLLELGQAVVSASVTEKGQAVRAAHAEIFLATKSPATKEYQDLRQAVTALKEAIHAAQRPKLTRLVIPWR